MPNLELVAWPSPQIFVKTQTGVFSISVFPVKPLINKNYHNSRTSNGIDFKLGPAIELDKTNSTTTKKSDDDVISSKYDVIVDFWIFRIFGAVRKPKSGHMAHDFANNCNTIILSCNNWKQNWKMLNTKLKRVLWKLALKIPNFADILLTFCWRQQNYRGLGTNFCIFRNYICVSTLVPNFMFLPHS